MAAIFRSARLEYRALESPRDDAFWHELQTDMDAVVGADAALVVPPSRAASEGLRGRILDKSLLAVVVCLPRAGPMKSEANEEGAATSATSRPAVEGKDSAVVQDWTPIGFLALRRNGERHAHHRDTEMAVDVLATHRGRGYGGEAIRWALGWAFRTAGLHRVALSCYTWNAGAARLYERLGFALEGRLREAKWHEGGWADELLFAMLENEWREAQQTPRALLPSADS